MPRPARISILALALLIGGCSDSSGPELFGCDRIARYEIGETVNGSVRSNDCSDPDDLANADFFQVRQSASGPVAFVVNVPEGSVRMFLVLIDSREEIVDLVEVMPGEEASVGGLLEEGTYFLAVGTDNPGTQSTYSLSSERAVRLSGPAFLGCAVAEDYTVGARVIGVLVQDDCVTADGGWMDRYEMTLPLARTITINLSSFDFDPFLRLFNSEGAILLRDDDSGGSLNSRITVSLPPGTYSIGVTAFDGMGVGAYVLEAEGSP